MQSEAKGLRTLRPLVLSSRTKNPTSWSCYVQRQEKMDGDSKKRERIFPFTTFFSPFRLPKGWMMPVHISESEFLHTAYWFNSWSFSVVLSQTFSEIGFYQLSRPPISQTVLHMKLTITWLFNNSFNVANIVLITKQIKTL